MCELPSGDNRNPRPSRTGASGAAGQGNKGARCAWLTHHRSIGSQAERGTAAPQRVTKPRADCARPGNVKAGALIVLLNPLSSRCHQALNQFCKTSCDLHRRLVCQREGALRSPWAAESAVGARWLALSVFRCASMRLITMVMNSLNRFTALAAALHRWPVSESGGLQRARSLRCASSTPRTGSWASPTPA